MTTKRPTVLLDPNWGADREVTDAELAELARQVRRQRFWSLVSIVLFMGSAMAFVAWMLLSYPIEH